MRSLDPNFGTRESQTGAWTGGSVIDIVTDTVEPLQLLFGIGNPSTSNQATNSRSINEDLINIFDELTQNEVNVSSVSDPLIFKHIPSLDFTVMGSFHLEERWSTQIDDNVL